MLDQTVVMTVFNIQPYLTSHGLNYESLLIFCLIWGMGGALISLAMSRIMAKTMMGVKTISLNTHDTKERALLDMVRSLSQQAGLSAVPEVGIYPSQEINAFATGPTQSRSLVAVSTGLLERMHKEQIEGILGHEIAHIANGDMVTMTLLQGIVNAFVMFAARVIAFVVVRAMSRSREGSGGSFLIYHLTVFALQIVFMILGSMVIAWFSRKREFRADAGGARYAGRHKMLCALEGLQQTVAVPVKSNQQDAFQALKISNPHPILKLFATHPPLDERISRLRQES